jgi:hypothetical protein
VIRGSHSVSRERVNPFITNAASPAGPEPYLRQPEANRATPRLISAANTFLSVLVTG